VHASASTTYVSGQLQARFDAWTLLGHFFQRLASSRETKNSTGYRVAVTIGSRSSADVEAHRLKRAVIYIFNFLIIKCLQRDVFLLLTMLLRQSNDLADNDLRILELAHHSPYRPAGHRWHTAPTGKMTEVQIINVTLDYPSHPERKSCLLAGACVGLERVPLRI